MYPMITDVAASGEVVAALAQLETRAQIRLFDLRNGTLLDTVPGPVTPSCMVAGPRSELFIATQGKIRALSMVDGKRSELGGTRRNYDVQDVDLSPSASLLAVLTAHDALIWNRETRERSASLKLKTTAHRMMSAIAVAPTDDEVAIAWHVLRGKTIKAGVDVCGLPSMKVVRSASTRDVVATLDWTEHGLFVGTQQALMRWNPRTFDAEARSRVSSVRARSHDGSTLASVSTRGDKAVVVSLADFEQTVLFEGRKGPSKPAHVALDPSGAYLVCGRGPELSVWSTEKRSELWSTELD